MNRGRSKAEYSGGVSPSVCSASAMVVSVHRFDVARIVESRREGEGSEVASEVDPAPNADAPPGRRRS